ncbi:MAG: hypothetical protein K0S48_2 [Ramlibacter sp.]|jgi:hypothetical protein|nr:hypothetical protein [Ramlibacter sp.]
MPTIPSGFKPLIRDYSIGAPGGVQRTEVAGGMSRYALQWDRGVQQFQVSMVLPPEKFAVWTAFFHHVIKKGAISFGMPLDSGFGLQTHSCNIVPGTYSAARAGGQITTISFVVEAESKAYDMTATEAVTLIDLWNEYEGSTDDLLARIAQFANVDSLVLDV